MEETKVAESRKQIDKMLLGKLNSLKGDLLSLDLSKGIKAAEWFSNVIHLNKNHQKEREIRSELRQENNADTEQPLREKIKEVQKKDFPFGLKFGDIIHVEFGIGIGDELRDGHYAVILSRKGEMFLIAPLTSETLYFGDNTLYFEGLGLPSTKGPNCKSYVSFSQIRYIHSRRIKKIHKIHKSLNGRIHLDEDKALQILTNYNKILVEGIEIR
jgi:mRNA-degrading endonuclease toxin of MazEF toxin-antitoxin module